MKINRDNYEAYFLDYHEGNLSPDSMEEVRFFVTENPDLRTVFEEFEAISLVADQHVVFEKKSGLKKNQVFATAKVNELNYEEYLIKETERLLNAEEISAIEEFITINPQFEKERRLYALAHLSVDDDIAFEAKESLKKKVMANGDIDLFSYETFMARELEGDLNEDESLQLAEFMRYNPQLENDRNLYANTILNADTHIVFENKSSLKHSEVIPLRRFVYYTVSVAASLALMISVYFLLDRNTIPQQLSQQGKVKNIVNQVITRPDQAIPEPKLASNQQKKTLTAPVSDQNSIHTSGSIARDEMAINSQREATMASTARQSIDALPCKSASEITTRSYVDPEFTFIRMSQMYMNQNLAYYYNLKLSQEIEYAELNSKDKNPGKTLLHSLTGKADDMLALNRETAPKEEKRDFSLWTVAELGVKTFNSITSSDLELNLQKNDEGKVVGYDLVGGMIDIEREIKK